MYERNHRNGSRERRRKGRRRSVRIRGILGAAGIGLLLMGAGKTLGEPALVAPVAASPAPTIVELIDDLPVQNRTEEEKTGQKPQEVQENSREEDRGAVQQADDWKLLLVNPWNPVPANYTVSLTLLKNGLSVDERCYPALQDMMDDCRAAGLSPVICSAYRTQEKQETLFNNRVKSLVSQGYAKADAQAEAAKAVAVPGTSEHQLGLAVDLVDLNNQHLDESQESTPVQKWLMENSWRYGFILRYPNEKSEITGIVYEPWHYRYVGVEAARDIYEQGVCLEEYLERLADRRL